MAKSISVRHKSFLPGAGRDASGAPKQGKTRVVGVITVSSYAGGSGEILKARDVGLSNIDFIQLRVSDENTGELSAAAAGGRAPIRQVSYTKSTGHFYLYALDADGVLLVVNTAATETVEFVAEGDSVQDVELL